MLFYDNIIINWSGPRSGVWFEYGTGNKVYNNIWYNCPDNVQIRGEYVEFDYDIYINLAFGYGHTGRPTPNDIVIEEDIDPL